MAVRVEPPRHRPAPREVDRYPGLTAEERGADPRPTPYIADTSEPPPPLWIVPSEVPPAARSVGFFATLPEPPPLVHEPPEGLFDVPGLLERLWLARALEAHQDRSWSTLRDPAPAARRAEPPRQVPPAPPSPVLPTLPLAPPTAEAARTAAELASSAPRAAPLSLEPGAGRPAYVGIPPVGWICPRCYLVNDAGSGSCRACRWAAPSP